MGELFRAIPDPDEDQVVKLRALLHAEPEVRRELPARPARPIVKPHLIQPVSLGGEIAQDHIKAPAVDTDWMTAAACSFDTHDLFFPGPGRGAADAAVAICIDCPVQSECLDYGMADDVNLTAGVFGGQTANARRNQAKRPKYRIH